MSDTNRDIEIKTYRDLTQLPASWDQFVASSSRGTIFHTIKWQRVLQQSYRFRFCGAAALDPAGALVGILPAFMVKSVLTGKRVVSSPFSYICGPLAENEEIEGQLLQRLVGEAEKAKTSYLEIKSLGRLPEQAKLAQSDAYSTYRIDLAPDEETIFKNTHKSQIQRGIKKAEKEGVEIRICNDENGIASFHRLNLITCRNHGIPAQPFKFHQLVLKELSPGGNVDYLLAYHADKPVAGIVVFSYGDTSVYMYGASDPAHLALRPNHLLLWKAISLAKERGISVFDLGRVSPDNTGLREFKERWGATATPLHYYYWPEVKGVGSIDRTSLKVRLSTLAFSKLPLWMTGRLTWLYRHLG